MAGSADRREVGADPREQLDDRPDPEWWSSDEAASGQILDPMISKLSEGVAQREDIEQLMQKALAGDIPRSRDLKPWEPDKLNPRHLQILLLKVSGMKQRTIAALLELDESNVSIVCNHPDSEYIMARMLSFAAENAIDVQAKMKLAAPAIADRLIDVALHSKKEELAAKVGFGLLDRAGYGAVHKAETKNEHKVVLEKKQAGLLADAIRESRQIEDADYTVVTPGSPRSEGGSPNRSGAEDTSAPPTGGSQASTTREKVA